MRLGFWMRSSVWAIGLASLLSAHVQAQQTTEVANVPIPANVDPFNLSFDQIKQYSSVKDFEILGHSYFKIPERTAWAKAEGRPGTETGSGFNTVRVYDGIAYLAGYSFPQTLYGILIADVRDPKAMKPLSFIPCNPGARCAYLRVNRQKHILMFGHDAEAASPNKLKPGEKSRSGWSFYDVSDPSKPRELSFVPALAGGKTHGMDADDRYVYGCSQYSADIGREGLQIIDYGDPEHAKTVSTWHVPGMSKGEEYSPLDQAGPDGKPQLIQCHEIVYFNDRLYLAWRDAGMQILDITDRSKPSLLGTYDYVPPFHGGFLGAAHTAAPVVVDKSRNPDLVLMTDEIFDCPNGFGRVVDVSDMNNPDVIAKKRPASLQPIATFRMSHVQDVFDYAKKEFYCAAPGGPAGSLSNTTHLPWFDRRSPSLVYVTWYDEGLRVMDITNPFTPTFTGYFLSPRFAGPGKADRETREVFQDPDTDLLYVTDGNGGGLTVLRYTGPIPKNPPLPGAR
jgi:hypothetical protein